MLLENKVALIYGGGGAIGAATARVFAREGARLFLAGRDESRLNRSAAAARSLGAEVSVAVIDAMDQGSVDAHADAVADLTGRIDVTLNAVGFDHVQGLGIQDTSLDDFLHPVTNYLRTNFVTAKAAARHMTTGRGGVILTISTPGARFAGPGLAANAAQSAGLEGLSRALAGELGPAGVRVVCVRPHALQDAFESSYTGEMFGRIAAGNGLSLEQWLDGAAATTLLGRLPSLADVAEYLAFAASDRAATMTGVVANLSAGALVD